MNYTDFAPRRKVFEHRGSKIYYPLKLMMLKSYLKKRIQITYEANYSIIPHWNPTFEKRRFGWFSSWLMVNWQNISSGKFQAFDSASRLSSLPEWNWTTHLQKDSWGKLGLTGWLGMSVRLPFANNHRYLDPPIMEELLAGYHVKPIGQCAWILRVAGLQRTRFGPTPTGNGEVNKIGFYGWGIWQRI